MTAPRIARAEQLRDAIRAALDAAGLQDVISTLDAALIPSAAREGVVVIAAPKLTFAGPFGDVQAAYEAHVIAGPADNYLVAWDRIDTIIDALVSGQINLRDGEPGAYESLHSEPIPAYTLTLNDLD